MSLRSLLKVPRYGLFYFESDKTVSVLPSGKVKKVIQGDNTSKGSIVEVYYGKDLLTAEIIAVDDDKGKLNRLLLDFLQDPKNKHRFPASDNENSEEELEIPKALRNGDKKKLVVVSKPPEVQIQTEDKQCGHTLERIEPATPSSGLKDDSKDKIESNAENLDALESGGYDDFEDDWDLHSTDAGDLQSFATKNDIKRLETQQEVILANQNVIIENLRGISNLLNEKAKKRGISLTVHEPYGHAMSTKKIKHPTPILNSTLLTSSAVSNDVADFGMPDDHFNESVSTSSLESELIKSPSSIRSDFSEKEISETSLGNSNPKNTKNTTLTPEELKKQAENKACLKEVCEMIGNSYSKAELSESSYEGGKRKYKGREFNKKGLSPARMKKIMKSVSQKHPEAYARLKDGPDLREAINMKCRKTSCKAQSSAQSSSGNANHS